MGASSPLDLRTPLCHRLGIEHPVIQAPIGLAAEPDLAAAVSQAGGLGMLALSNAPTPEIHRRIARTRSLTDRPFGINLLLQDDQSPQLEACLDAGIRIISFSWRLADGQDPHLRSARAADATVLWTVGSAAEARRAVDAGVDVVVAQGIEAGGHVWGTVGTLPLVPAVVDAVEPVPVVAAGGIGDGRGLAAALCLGAQAAWLGTRFLLSDESSVHPVHAQLAIDAAEDDTAYTTLFDVGWPDAPHRTIRNSTWRRWSVAGSPPSGRRPGEGDPVARGRDGSTIPRYAVGHPTTGWVSDGDVEAMALYAGQSVGVVRDRRPAAEIVARLVADAAAVLASAGRDPAG